MEKALGCADVRLPRPTPRGGVAVQRNWMVAVHGAEPPAIAAAYNFTDFGAVVDVGGATGNMLAAILARYPGPRGSILF